MLKLLKHDLCGSSIPGQQESNLSLHTVQLFKFPSELYLFICLFGNIVTGAFLYKHEIMYKKNETMKDILTARLNGFSSFKNNMSGKRIFIHTNELEREDENEDLVHIMSKLQLNNSPLQVSTG